MSMSDSETNLDSTSKDAAEHTNTSEETAGRAESADDNTEDVDTVDLEEVPQENAESADNNTEAVDLEEDPQENAGDDQANAEKATADCRSISNEKSSSLPLSKIKLIMKTDPDVSICSAEAAFLITRCTVSGVFSWSFC